MELTRYRYLPLHLAILYLYYTEDLNYFAFSDLVLSSVCISDDKNARGLSILHKSRKTPNPWAEPVELKRLKLKTPYDGVMHLFNTPMYPGRTYDPKSVEEETPIIYARNKKLRRIVSSLVELEAQANATSLTVGKVPFALVVPFLFLNKKESLHLVEAGSMVPKEITFDAQNVSIRIIDFVGGAKYGKNPNQSEILGWYDSYLELNRYGKIEDRMPRYNFYSFYIPKGIPI